MNYYIFLLIGCYINFLSAMQDQHTQDIYHLQQEIDVPVFVLSTIYRPLAAQTNTQQHAHLILSGQTAQVNIEQSYVTHQRARFYKQNISELAQIYGLVMTLNKPESQELIEQWTQWSNKIPNLATQVEDYLASPYMFSVIDSITSQLPNCIEETALDMKYAKNFIDMYASIFKQILSNKIITEQDTLFIVKCATKFLGIKNSQIYRYPAIQQNWLSIWFNKTLEALETSSIGKQILETIKAHNPEINETLESINFIDQFSLS